MQNEADYRAGVRQCVESILCQTLIGTDHERALRETFKVAFRWIDGALTADVRNAKGVRVASYAVQIRERPQWCRRCGSKTGVVPMDAPHVESRGHRFCDSCGEMQDD